MYRIKPLEWLKGSDSRWYAATIFRPICVTVRRYSRAEWWFERHGIAGDGANAEDAKRNAEAEYQSHILRALEEVK